MKTKDLIEILRETAGNLKDTEQSMTYMLKTVKEKV